MTDNNGSYILDSSYEPIMVDEIENPLTNLTLNAVSSEERIFNTDVTDIQEDIVISGSSIRGKLKYLDTGDIVNSFGAGYFIAVDLSDNDFSDLTSVKIGMNPSGGSDMVELINNVDKNGVVKVSNKYNQKFVIVSTDGTYSKTQMFNLSQLELVRS